MSPGLLYTSNIVRNEDVFNFNYAQLAYDTLYNGLLQPDPICSASLCDPAAYKHAPRMHIFIID